MTGWRPRSRPRRAGLVALVAVAAIVVVAVAAVASHGYRSDGPLTSSGALTVEFPLRGDQPGAWGTVLPMNPTASDILIDSIEPVNPRGLRILGVSVNDPQAPGGAVGTLDAYPPPNIATRPVRGAVLAPKRYLQVLFGVQLADPTVDGSIDSLRLRYTLDGVGYEAVLPDALHLVPATE